MGDKNDCDRFDKKGLCHLNAEIPRINQTVSGIKAGRDLTIKPTINFEYNEEIEKLECDKIETDINGKPIAEGCRVQFRDDEVIKRLLSEHATA